MSPEAIAAAGVIVAALSAALATVITSHFDRRTALGVAEEKTEADRLGLFLAAIQSDNTALRARLDEVERRHHDCDVKLVAMAGELSKQQSLIEHMRDELNHLRHVGTPIALVDAGRLVADSMVERVQEIIPPKRVVEDPAEEPT